MTVYNDASLYVSFDEQKVYNKRKYIILHVIR